MKIVSPATALLAVLLLGCTSQEPVPGTEPGEPWPDLSAADLAAFTQGRDLFDKPFTPEEGLGPGFNQSRCSSCHDLPTLGGAGVERALKATAFRAGRCDLLSELGGDMLQQRTTPALQAHGLIAEGMPQGATAVVSLLPPPLYGLAAIEAIPERAILRNEDVGDKNGDGISGRAGRTADGSLGRFGRKANFATVRAFSENALHDEMGLTSHAFPTESDFGGRPLPAGVDPAPDPEIDDATLARLIRYLDLLALPAPEVPGPARDSIRQGSRVFERIGCAACHTPSFRTGDHELPALQRKTMVLYSDLLLHDLGENLASICSPNAEPAEWRTAPLYGLRHRRNFLHDGRAQTIESAIRAHGGEAEPSRLRFQALPPEQQAFLLRFLRSL